MNYFDALCNEVPKLMQRYRVPGLAVGVWHNGKLHTAGFGVTNINNSQPVTPNTLFQIGSISKTFLGTAVMRLVEQGLVDLDTPIKQYLPKFKMRDKRVQNHVTLRHLLTHTGGWLGDYFQGYGWNDDALQRMTEAIGRLPQLTPLGTLWSYNNAGFNLTGRVIECVTGTTYENALHLLVFKPLQLQQAFFFPSDVMLHEFSVGHISPTDAHENIRVANPYSIGRSSHAAGGVVLGVADLLAYARFHLGDGSVAGKRILKKATLKNMHTAQVNAYGAADEWALSFALRQHGTAKIMRHGGATNGFTADLSLCHAENFAIATLTNSDMGSALYSELNALAFKLYLNAEKPALQPIRLPTDTLKIYVGDYDAPLTKLSVRLKDGALAMQMIPKGGFPDTDSPPSSKPLPFAKLVFDALDKATLAEGVNAGQRVEWIRNQRGQLAWLHTGGRIHAIQA